MKKLSSTLPNMLLSLMGVCIVVSGILAYLNYITKEPIAKAQVNAKIKAISAVTPAFDNNPFDERFKVLVPGEIDSLTVYPARKGEELVGYAIETYTKSGFNGLISIMMGIDISGKLVDFSVLEIAETPGLGSKIPEWFRSEGNTSGHIKDVRGLDLPSEAPLKVYKDGGKVDAITAATISSRAFLDAINRGYQASQIISQQ